MRSGSMVTHVLLTSMIGPCSLDMKYATASARNFGGTAYIVNSSALPDASLPALGRQPCCSMGLELLPAGLATADPMIRKWQASATERVVERAMTTDVFSRDVKYECNFGGYWIHLYLPSVSLDGKDVIA